MQIKLGKVDLVQPSTDDGERHQELRTILSISIKDKRKIVEQQIPGSAGNRLQDQGTEPVQISLEGEMFGEEASKTIESIYDLYEEGKALSFQSNLGAIAEVNKVSLENFQVNKSPGTEMHYSYTMELKESRPQS